MIHIDNFNRIKNLALLNECNWWLFNSPLENIFTYKDIKTSHKIFTVFLYLLPLFIPLYKPHWENRIDEILIGIS